MNAKPEQAVPMPSDPSLFYDPPYERPLDDEFAWHLVKYLSPVTRLEYRPADVGVDFLVEVDGRRAGFQITGYAHAPLEHLDQLDKQLVAGGQLDVLYRFRAADVAHHIHDCLGAVLIRDPWLFSDRGAINLRSLSLGSIDVVFTRHGSAALTGSDGFDDALRLYNIIFGQEHTQMEQRVRERLAGELVARGLGHMTTRVLATLRGDDSVPLAEEPTEEEKVRRTCRRVQR